MRVRITVPATSANIGAGFDSMGIALSLYNRIEMEEAENFCVTALDGKKIPTGEENLICEAAKEVYSLCGKKLPGLLVWEKSDIPFTRGLGSSSACIVAGILGANSLLGNPLKKEELINLAAVMEGHPDNSTPAILGSLVVATLEEKKVQFVKIPVAHRLLFGVFIPDYELSTQKSRGVLPDKVDRADAVYNLSHAALTAVSLMSGDLHNIERAVGDRLHQPYRFPLIPGGREVFEIAKKAGAYGTYISGAGPSLIAIVDKKDENFKTQAEKQLRASGSHFSLSMMCCEENGAKVEILE